MQAWAMFCKICGQSVKVDDKFCMNCGTPIAQEQFESAVTTSSSTAGTALSATRASSTAAMGRQLTGAGLRRNDSEPAEALAEHGSQGLWHDDSPVELADESELAQERLQDQPQQQEIPGPASAALESQECPHCGRLNPGQNKFCESCGAELASARGLPSVAAAPITGPTESADMAEVPVVAVPSFGSYGRSTLPAREPRVARNSRLPLLEILVAVLLLVGAGMALWMLRSSLPGNHGMKPSNVDVRLTPAKARVPAGNGFDFAATVAGAENYEVSWTVQEGDAGGRVVPRGAKAQGGKVSSLAVYIAPNTPGTYHLLATSRADPRKSAMAEIVVTGR